MKRRVIGVDKFGRVFQRSFVVVFNLKRILGKVGLGSSLGSFAVALALLIKEDKSYAQHKDSIESAIVTYLKEENLYNSGYFVKMLSGCSLVSG